MSENDTIRYILQRFDGGIARRIFKLLNAFHKNPINKEFKFSVAGIIREIGKKFHIKDVEIPGLIMCHGIVVILTTEPDEKLFKEKISSLYDLIEIIKENYPSLKNMQHQEILMTVAIMTKNESYKLFESQILSLNSEVVKVINDGTKKQKYSMNKIENSLKIYLNNREGANGVNNFIKNFLSSLNITIEPDDFKDYFIINRIRKVLYDDYDMELQLDEFITENTTINSKLRDSNSLNNGIQFRNYIINKLNLFFRERPKKKKLKDFASDILKEAEKWSSEPRESVIEFLDKTFKEWASYNKKWKKWAKKIISAITIAVKTGI